jgi:DnaJ-class molecular chaperone
MKDPYDTLGVDKNATEEEIKKAYRDKSKEQHPDKGGDEEEFKKTSEAYAIIGTPNKRKQYDETGSTDTEDPLANIHRDVSEMFFNVIQHNQRNIEHTDIIQEMLKIISNAISMAKSEIPKKDKGIKEMEKLLNRIDKKNDSAENFFEGIIQGKIQQIKRDKLMVNNSIERFNLMIDMIELYHCETKEVQTTSRRGGIARSYWD